MSQSGSADPVSHTVRRVERRPPCRIVCWPRRMCRSRERGPAMEPALGSRRSSGGSTDLEGDARADCPARTRGVVRLACSGLTLGGRCKKGHLSTEASLRTATTSTLRPRLQGHVRVIEYATHYNVAPVRHGRFRFRYH